MMNLPLNVDFTGKVVVVTGAGGVLCGDMARAYAQAGAKVAALDLNEEAVLKLAADLTAKGFTCIGYKANVLDAEALEEVNERGYGIVMPNVEDLHLEEPQIVKQAGGYGVKLRAAAQSVHMIRANIAAEINPMVGTEQQSEDMVRYLLKEFEEDPKSIWGSNLFGKSLYELINEGLHNKLEHMPEESRKKLSETLERIINEGSNGLICILL